jgi:hypothetical protein
MINNHPILIKPIAEMVTSEEFLQMAHRNHFHDLRQILEHPVHDLMNREGFNYRMLDELIIILKGYDLLDLLREN